MKKWYQSRTMWVNMLATLAAVVLLATQVFELSAETLTWLLFIQGTLNIVLRSLTGEPIVFKK
jgi:hypothetical protein